MNLVNVNPPAKKPERARDLIPAFLDRTRPDFGGHDRRFSSALKCITQDPLSLAVHRGRIEEGCPGSYCTIDHRARVRFRGMAAHVKRAPGTHADDGNLKPGTALQSLFHRKINESGKIAG